ncbi:hypothetical protein GQR58_024681 [Nymphon striatum]|nr:hypothetical protein GQR58_024681 [Nymphon striatum]
MAVFIVASRSSVAGKVKQIPFNGAIYKNHNTANISSKIFMMSPLHLGGVRGVIDALHIMTKHHCRSAKYPLVAYQGNTAVDILLEGTDIFVGRRRERRVERHTRVNFTLKGSTIDGSLTYRIILFTTEQEKNGGFKRLEIIRQCDKKGFVLTHDLESCIAVIVSGRERHEHPNTYSDVLRERGKARDSSITLSFSINYLLLLSFLFNSSNSMLLSSSLPAMFTPDVVLVKGRHSYYPNWHGSGSHCHHSTRPLIHQTGQNPSSYTVNRI